MTLTPKESRNRPCLARVRKYKIKKDKVSIQKSDSLMIET